MKDGVQEEASTWGLARTPRDAPPQKISGCSAVIMYCNY